MSDFERLRNYYNSLKLRIRSKNYWKHLEQYNNHAIWLISLLNFNSMKLPSVYTDLCSKQVFKNPTLSCNARPRSVVNSARSCCSFCWLFMMRLRPHPNCNGAMHFPLDLQATYRSFPPSPHTIIQDPSGQLWGHWTPKHRPGKGSLRKVQIQPKNYVFLSQVGSTNYLAYSQAHPPKVGSIPPSEIVHRPLM